MLLHAKCSSTLITSDALSADLAGRLLVSYMCWQFKPLQPDQNSCTIIKGQHPEASNSNRSSPEAVHSCHGIAVSSNHTSTKQRHTHATTNCYRTQFQSEALSP
jgi:hypothetical protein